MEKLTNMALSKALKQMRMDRRLTQVRLAEAVGVSTFTLIRWERGERSPDGVFLERLSRALGYWIVLDTDGTWSCFPQTGKEPADALSRPSVDEVYEQAAAAKDKSVWTTFFRKLTQDNPTLESWLRSSDGGEGLDDHTLKTMGNVILAMVRD